LAFIQLLCCAPGTPVPIDRMRLAKLQRCQIATSSTWGPGGEGAPLDPLPLCVRLPLLPPAITCCGCTSLSVSSAQGKVVPALTPSTSPHAQPHAASHVHGRPHRRGEHACVHLPAAGAAAAAAGADCSTAVGSSAALE